MKKIVLLLALFALFSCSEESISPVDYDINGVWKGKGNFTVSYSSEPGKMDIEFILDNGKFVEFSYSMLSEGSYSEDVFNDGKLTKSSNEIYIEIFNTSANEKNREKVFTFTGKVLSNESMSGSLLMVWRGIGDNGNFILKK